MSAIAGIYHLNDEPVNLEHGRRIMKELEKYPADDVQTWHSDKVFLGCHAQWITPESIGEKLPYYDHARKLAITADAIIDNREELFERLQIKKERRKDITDSELILLSYEKWKDESPKYLIGDFAFMIWDEKNQKLFGARDFSGNRTLYFNQNQQKFSYCTVIQPLLTLPYIDKELNEQWLAEFLTIPEMFDTVDTSSSVYKNIEQLPPSHCISVMRGKVTLSRYYTINFEQKLQLQSDNDYVEAFRDVFNKAVTARLRTHHPIGAYLSGGLDSGSVVSFAAKALSNENKRLNTFSYVPISGFEDWTPKRRIADESPLIKSTVEYVGNINDHYLDFKDKTPLTEVDDWLNILETPYKFFENSYWLKGIYEEAHKKGIGILLNGSRGNYTISWGPALDFYATLLKRMKWIRLYHELQQYSKNIGLKKSIIAPYIGRKAFPLLERISSSNSQSHFPTFINPQFAKKTNIFGKLQDSGIDIKGSVVPNAFEVRKKQFENLFSWNTNGTSKAKLSLQYSLWDRDPTNDLRVIRFCLSVPNEQFIKNGLDRALVRRATEGFLPDSVRLNQRTRGIQGADGIYRMAPYWGSFLKEIRHLSKDPNMNQFINMKVIYEAISMIKEKPQLDYILNPNFKILMRSIILYRFLKNFT